MTLRHRFSTTCLCGHTFAPHLLSAQAVVVDLGVNRGEFAHAVTQRFACGVYGAEPTPALAGALAGRPGLQILPAAIGATIQRAPFYIYCDDTASSLLFRPDVARRETARVNVVTLTAFLEYFSLDHVDLLKMDIEGAEAAVFASTPDEVWQRCTQVTVEFHAFAYPDWRSVFAAARHRMERLGFYCIDVSGNAADVLFINRERADISRLDYLAMNARLKYLGGLSRQLRRVLGKTKRALTRSNLAR